MIAYCPACEAPAIDDGAGCCLICTRTLIDREAPTMRGAVTILQHNLDEWRRCARALYAAGCNGWGHRLAAAAAVLSPGDQVPPWQYDQLQDVYRDWLVSSRMPPADPTRL